MNVPLCVRVTGPEWFLESAALFLDLNAFLAWLAYVVFWVWTPLDWTLDRLRAPWAISGPEMLLKPEVYDAIGSLVRRLVLRPIIGPCPRICWPGAVCS